MAMKLTNIQKNIALYAVCQMAAQDAENLVNGRPAWLALHQGTASYMGNIALNAGVDREWDAIRKWCVENKNFNPLECPSCLAPIWRELEVTGGENAPTEPTEPEKPQAAKRGPKPKDKAPQPTNEGGEGDAPTEPTEPTESTEPSSDDTDPNAGE